MLILPTLVVLALLSFYPLISAFLLSLQDVPYSIAKAFVGLTNYSIFVHDWTFWTNLWHTVYFMVVSVVLEFFVGLIIALTINKTFRGRGIVRVSILVPWALPTVVCAKMFKWIYDPQYSVLNDILMRLHLISEPIGWLINPVIALNSCVLLDVWKCAPWMALLLLAGLQVIPQDLYNASKVDGAGAWKCFTQITLPLLKPAIVVALVFRMLDAFKVYGSIWVLTGGGPAGSTEVLSTSAYKYFFSWYPFNFGMGCALSVITFLCVLAMSFVYIKALSKPVEM